MTITGYVGTYTTGNSQGIYSFTFNTQTNNIDNTKLFTKIQSPKYLCFAGKNNEYIATVCDFTQPLNGHTSGITLLDKQGNHLNQIGYENTTSCYITHKNNYLYTANYHEGTISVIKIEENNTLTLVNKTLIKEKAGCHQILFHENKTLVPCLFLDKIIILNEQYETENHIQFPTNSGPRHAVFTKDHKYLYVVGELDNMLYVIDTKTMSIINQTYLLENKQTHLKDSAAIRLSENEEWLYVSTRTQDIISTFKINETDKTKLELKQNYPTGGQHPRDFEIQSNIAFITNRLTNDLTTIKIENGLLTQQIQTTQIPEAISIILENN